jgi:putative nucleotidyltransferase with HDIG domain
MKKEKNKGSIEAIYRLGEYFKWLLLAIVTVTVTVIIYPSLIVRQHTYQLGDVAEKDIKAPKDFLFEDKEATAVNQREAMENVLTVYDHDTTLLEKLTQNINSAFEEMRALLNQPDEKNAGPTDETQPAPSDLAVEDVDEKTPLEIDRNDIKTLVWDKKPDFEKKLDIALSSGAFSLLEKADFSENTSYFIIKILSEILDNGVVANKEILLKESDRGISLREIALKTEKKVTNLRGYYGLDQSKVMVRIIGQPLLKDVNYNLRNLIVDMVQRMIRPNITLNRNETEERRKQAALEIKPVFFKIKAGEMLLREGDRVTNVQLLKLKSLEALSEKKGILARGVGAAISIMGLLIVIYILYTPYLSKKRGGFNKNLLFITSVFIFYIVMAKLFASYSETLTQGANDFISNRTLFYGIPMASGAMTLCLFLSMEIAIPFAILIAVCTTAVFNAGIEIFIYLLISGTMAAYWVRDCRERKVFIKAGLKLGVLNIAMAIAAEVYSGNLMGYSLLGDAAFAFIGGIVAGVVTAGLAPLMELAFGYTTDITLLELANLDRPILRRLMIEAPGTYHHSMVVGTMVEAAASEIGANPLLSKVCGYYHDIGKIKKPLYFIENQRGGVNRHDKLAPSMSSLILIAHIKNGVEMARENKLGQAIIDTIQQHHGTSLIRYFYEKARQLKGKDAVKIDDFRYPGPRPQTREAGLVMLADVLEAASRTVENPTPARIQRLVQELINKIFSDGQLDNCELTLKDLHNIARIFNKILTAIHHHRIEYAETAALTSGNGKNGSTDRQQTKKLSDTSEKLKEESSGRLKRLGMS